MAVQHLPHPESVEAIADRLKRTREAMGLTQAAWCRLVGIEPQQWNNYERARNKIALGQALKVVHATGATLEWIFRGEMAAGLPATLQAALQKKR